jgi:hypothetical protein
MIVIHFVAFNSRQIQYLDSYKKQRPKATTQLKETFAKIFRLRKVDIPA